MMKAPSFLLYGYNNDRAEIRSKTFGGFAQAMADQWGECEKHLTQLSLECYV